MLCWSGVRHKHAVAGREKFEAVSGCGRSRFSHGTQRVDARNHISEAPDNSESRRNLPMDAINADLVRFAFLTFEVVWRLKR
jgi:hypothetical protein